MVGRDEKAEKVDVNNSKSFDMELGAGPINSLVTRSREAVPAYLSTYKPWNRSLLAGSTYKR